MIKEQITLSFEASMNFLIQEGLFSEESLLSLKDMSIEQPKDQAHGDYAVNIAMLLGKKEQKPPRQIAESLVNVLKENTYLFESVTVAGPGFINLRINNQALVDSLPEVLGDEHFGRTTLENKSNVLIEFVSANPTGGLHLGHARPAFVGDAVARLLQASGFNVTREFYVNDAGNQIETLARTIHKRYQELFGRAITIEAGEYPGAYVIDIAKALKELDGDRWLDKPESDWLIPLAHFGVKANLAKIKSTLAELGISFDEWYSEQTLHENGALIKLFDRFLKDDLLYEADEAHGTSDKVRREDSKAHKFKGLQQGGWFLKTSSYGDEEDRIIRRKDGRFVYMTADIAYHHHKYERGFQKLIDVFGADHAGHIDRLVASMRALRHNEQQLSFVVVQMVRLIKDGQEVKFSKRAGQIYGIDDLVEEIGKDAARFVFLMRSPKSQFDLDLNLLTKKSNDNPVFYVQYAHARLASILTKAAQEKATSNEPIGTLQIELLPEERSMLLRVFELPEAVRLAAMAYEPHRLIYYCQEIVRLFHSYFTQYRHTERVLSDDPEKTKFRLMLVQALKIALHNALDILGIHAPERMEPPQSDATTGE